MDIKAFGKALLTSGDLDPVYPKLVGAKLAPQKLYRVLLGYWCFYHLGHAAYLADQRDFGDALMRSAKNVEPAPDGGRWPRSAERRHFRGAQAVAAVSELLGKYESETLALLGVLGRKNTRDFRVLPFSAVTAAAKSHRGFGDWIAFKIADMSDRVLGMPVDFSDCALGIYKDPRQGAALARGLRLGTDVDRPWETPINEEEFRAECEHWIKYFSNFVAPPRGDRAVNIQEVETIFCKFKSHYKGHYPVGKDTKEIQEGLEHWAPYSPTARALARVPL